ncbi:DUF2306 domain-containing protein [uncultured Roseobacter sp.]|uniref:DUF2306 domain-containing protein n=1 Tax=uncultured Roseobacter sp. TaxID=114847 RepID=UPI0026377894|nr:DUF2306 domain-containing protein [uncultured Roseobacter sp.]
MQTARYRQIFIRIGLVFLILHSLPFAIWAMHSGALLLISSDMSENRFYTPGGTVINLAIFAHMSLGALLMVFVPLQFWPGLRARFVAYHRWSGRLLCVGSAAVGLAGLAYIFVRGTIGGFWMDLGFGVYGVLFCLSAGQAIRYARRRDFAVHRRWALRVLVLTFGSWLYRLHYGIWYFFTDGLASTPDFDGTFDLVQNFAFYLPYLLLLELWLRREPRTA